MNSASALRRLAKEVDAEASLGERIEDFLSGRSNGEDLFQAMYGHILDEKIPESMKKLLRGGGGGEE
jgi:hypothetical protein